MDAYSPLLISLGETGMIGNTDRRHQHTDTGRTQFCRKMTAAYRLSR